MKSNMKMIAVAAAMASMVGAAQADIVTNPTNNGTLVIGAVNTVTKDWYLRDTGLTLNQFLPSNVTTLSGDGSITGSKTPGTGLVLDKTTNAGFADAAFSTWFGAQAPADVRWFVSANDNIGSATATNVKRFIASSANPSQAATNATVDNYTASGNGGGLGSFFNPQAPGTLSVTGTLANPNFGTNFVFGGAGLTTVGTDSALFYVARTVGTGSTSAPITLNGYSNGAGRAVISLNTAGDFAYTLAPEGVSAVPVPAAAWLLVSGLTAMGGAARRRKGAAKA